MSVRYGSTGPGRSAGAEGGGGGGGWPRADVLIHAPGRLASEIRKGKPPCFDWGNQFERALREATRGGCEARVIQRVESGPIDAPRPGAMGLGLSGGDAMALGGARRDGVGGSAW